MGKEIIRLLVICFAASALATGCASCEDEAGTGANNGGSGFDLGDGGSGDGGANNGAADGGANNGATDAGANNGTSDMTSTDTSNPPQDANTPFEQNDAGQILCGDHVCACSNGMDDDNDGLVDGFDPECTGPYDDDEDSFATGISGDNKDPKWQDCFFDGNSGAGDDKCRYRTECLTGELPASDPDCQVSQQCFDFCQRLTPNGCDCFGCCEVTKPNGDTVNIVIGGTCDFENLDSPDCQTCTQTTACLNECGECELCLGKTVDDLPDSCSSSGGDMGSGGDDAGSGDAGGGDDPGYTCDDGQTVCQTQGDCSANYYCQQGCCIEVIL